MKGILELKEQSKAGKMIVGSSTPSYDLETKPNVFYQTDHINEKLIYEKAWDVNKC